MKKIGFLPVLLIVLLFSCKDNQNNLDAKLSIGKSNADIIVHTLNPPLSVTYQIPDSIDVNGDNKYDLIFDKIPTPLTNGYGLETRMTKKNKTQVVISVTNNYPDSLSYSDNINNVNNWSDTSNKTLLLQSYFDHKQDKIIGNFVVDQTKYLGIKMGNRYGWVKLKNEIPGSLIIYEYALMK
jgi:hypothetical protein